MVAQKSAISVTTGRFARAHDSFGAL
jgi:hypothetical protein